MCQRAVHKLTNILSVDVEDWFHILELTSSPDVNEWNSLESRVKDNFYALLDEFEQADTQVTCFFLGWIADRFPEMVVEACKRGHEIASHGYSHRLVYTQTREEFARKMDAIAPNFEYVRFWQIEGSGDA